MENEETTTQASAEAEVPEAGSAGNEVDDKTEGSGKSGEAKEEFDPSDYVPKSQYEALESKFGEQGRELGGVRQVYQRLRPLLSKLDESPELVKAIMAGKVDARLAQAALDGKLSVGEAQEITKAHEEVKKDMGDKEYAKADPAEIEKLIESKISASLAQTKRELTDSLSEEKAVRIMERNLDEFLARTPDYADYAEEINQWFEEHRDQWDPEIAYLAVKGRRLTEKAAKEKAKAGSEEQKKAMANAAGGQSSRTQIVEGEDEVSKYVRLKANPNVF